MMNWREFFFITSASFWTVISYSDPFVGIRFILRPISSLISFPPTLIHSHFLLYLLRITSLSLSRFFSSVELWDEKGREKLLVRQNGRRIPPRLRLSSSVSRQFAVWGHVGRKEAASVCDLCVLNITHSACFFFVSEIIFLFLFFECQMHTI